MQLASRPGRPLAGLVGHIHVAFVLDVVTQMMVGLVDHIAAQTSLANIFTRVQISFTTGIRVRDIVVIDDDWGPEHRVGLLASAGVLGIIAGHLRGG
ncbi:MAG TPA: hypothetical protein VFI46_05490, partial [Jiangellaceae bacterium]|nr:hypothetical protein [Jiangellaceae bacterium]